MCWALFFIGLTFLTAINSDSSARAFDLKNTPRRHLTQRQRNVVDVADADALVEAFDSVTSGQTIRLRAGRYFLTTALLLNVPNVTVTGIPSLSRISCPNGETGLTIRANNSIIRGAVFENCQNAPAVVVDDGSDGDNEAVPVSVIFENVEFSGNTILTTSGVDPSSAALTIQGCLLTPCGGTVPIVTVIQCIFEQNRSPAGGGIYCTNCELSVSDTTFTNNTASTSGGAIAVRGEDAEVEVTTSRFVTNIVTRDGSSRELARASGLPIEPFKYFNFLFPTNRGGAISVSTVNDLTLSRCTFRSNTAPAGGAISIEADESFLRRNPPRSSSVVIEDCTFTDNAANRSLLIEPQNVEEENYLGGAVYLVSNTDTLQSWTINGCNFSGNTAQHGAAFHVVTVPQVAGTVDTCEFDDNKALQSGGAIVVRGTSALEIRGSVFRRNSANLGGAIVTTNNGFLLLAGLAGIDLDARQGVPNVFQDNIAVYGAGVMCVGCGDLLIRDVQFLRNRASRSGGGLYVLDSTAQVEVLQSTFDSNVASEGAGAGFRSAADVSVTSINRDFRNIFTNNTAIAGAGIFAEGTRQQENQLTISSCQFARNRALSVFDPDFPFRREIQRTARNDDDAEVQESDNLADYRLTNCGNGGGGGICLLFDDVPEDSLNDVVLESLNFTRNEALVGGGVFVRVAGDGWNNDREISCSRPTPTTNPCRIFHFIDLRILNNRAMFWGGGLFINQPQTVLIGCSDEQPTDYDTILAAASRRRGLKGGQCSVIEDNRVLDENGGHGVDIGSVVHSLFVEDPTMPLTNQTGGQRLLPPCPDMNDCPDNRTDGIKVAVKDVFNQTITGGIPDSELRVILISSSILGEQIYIARNGIVNVNNTVGVGIGESSNITFQHEQFADLNTTLSFMTRECYPGEQQAGTQCEECMAEQYGFNTSSICLNCEERARCAGGAALVPNPGYWHSTPFSPQFHKCIIERACMYENRSIQLLRYYHNGTRVASELAELEAYIAGNGERPQYLDYEQCGPGYEGTLCGSCAAGYGYFAGGECRECPKSEARAGFFIFLTSLLTFAIISINIVVTISSTRKQIQIALSGDGRPSNRSRPSGGRSFRLGPQEVELTEQQAENGQNYANDYRSAAATPLILTDPDGNAIGATDHFIAVEKLTEILKILVNYLQVTSVALSINLSWNEAIKILLSVQNSVISVTSGSYYVPLDCVIGDRRAKNGTPGSIKAFWWRVSFPFMFLFIFLILVQIIELVRPKTSNGTASGSTAGARNDKDREKKTTYSIVITLIVIYFSYINLTSEFMRAVNCIHVDDDMSDPHHEYDRYAIANGTRFWAEDTELRCFKGAHVVTGVLSIVGLICMGMIIVIIFWFFPNNMQRLKVRRFIARFGFLYQGYKEAAHTVGWEAVITLRKGLISAAVIFAFPLGPNLQAVCALGVLIIALALHWMFTPFKSYDEHRNVPKYCGVFFNRLRLGMLSTPWRRLHNRISLNGLESVSLLMSIIVFYSGLIFNDSNTSDAGKYAMAAFALSTNLCFMLYIIYRLYVGLHLAFDMHSWFFSGDRHFDISAFPKNGSICAFVRKIVALFKYTYYHHDTARQLSEYVGDTSEDRPSHL